MIEMQYTNEYWNDIAEVIGNIPKIEELYHKRILITGAAGMVCSPLVEIVSYLNKNLSANIKLILAGRSRERIHNRFKDILAEDGYCFIPYDATKYGFIEDIETDYIIHGAGNAYPAICARQPVETLIGNIAGLNTILKLASNNKNCRVLYVSSSEIYGNRNSASQEPFKEEEYCYVDILNPRACYPNGKRASETLCACYRQEHGVDSVIVRLGHIYGPTITLSDTRASASFTRDAVNGRDIVMKSAGNQLRSYCYTLDCASAILTVLLNGMAGNAYNVSNKNSIVSIKDMAEELAKYAGVHVIYEKPSEIEQKSYNLMINSSLDSNKIESLGWKACFTLEKGVKRTIQVMRGGECLEK
jgi:nucleoside-diphosphate-sugar epimerase